MFITLSCAATAFQSCTVAQAPAPAPPSGQSDQWIHVPPDIQEHDDWGSFQDFAAMAQEGSRLMAEIEEVSNFMPSFIRGHHLNSPRQEVGGILSLP